MNLLSRRLSLLQKPATLSSGSPQKVEDPYRILDTVEFKTAWHPIGV